MSRPIGGSALLLLLLPLLSGACGGKGLGSEVAGAKGNVKVAYSFNVRLVEPEKRTPPKAFEGRTLDANRTIGRADLAGRVTVVNFWGAWCGECYREQPMLNDAHARFSARGVDFLGVDVRDPHKADALSFVEQLKVPYPSIYDPDLQVAHAFGVYHFPTTYVLDRRGRVGAVIVSLPKSFDELSRVIEQVMG